MKRKLFTVILASILFMLVGCASIADFYEEALPIDAIDPDCLLKDGEEPDIFYVSDAYSTVNTMRAKYFCVLGSSSYNGPADNSLEKKIKQLCIQNKAPIAVYGYQYTDTRYGVSSYGRYVNSYSIPRYDYDIIFYVPMSENEVLYFGRIGIACSDLTAEERSILHRNTGAKVTTVFESSPAFYANISTDDVIFEVNGTSINNSAELTKILDSATAEDSLEIKLSRNGIDKTITLKPLF